MEGKRPVQGGKDREKGERGGTTDRQTDRGSEKDREPGIHGR